MSHEAVQALEKLGIEHEGRSKLLSEEMILGADLVLCMTESHLATARHLVEGDAEAQSRLHLLEPNGDAVPDPIGMGQEAYSVLAGHFREVIPPRIESLLADS